MRKLLIAIAMSGALSVAAQAGDDSPIAGKLPDNSRSQTSYLFMLKKNGLSLRIKPDQFCEDLGYGVAATRKNDGKGFWQLGKDEYDEHGKLVPELEWVICQFPAAMSK
jgi:hypothetical protein